MYWQRTANGFPVEPSPDQAQQAQAQAYAQQSAYFVPPQFGGVHFVQAPMLSQGYPQQQQQFMPQRLFQPQYPAQFVAQQQAYLQQQQQQQQQFLQQRQFVAQQQQQQQLQHKQQQQQHQQRNAQQPRPYGQASPQQQLQHRQQSLPRGDGKHFSIDVECVATGTDHNARAVAQVALVDSQAQPLLNLYIRPEKAVVSYLTPLTGLTKEMIDRQGMPIEAAMKQLRQRLPQTAVLVGQNIGKDVQWLGLKEGQDFESLLDLAGLYRIPHADNPRKFYRFGQDHLVKVLLGWDTSANHDAVGDAIKSMKLFNYYQQHHDTVEWKQAQEKLLSKPPEPSFAKQHPSFEGVCMGNVNTCTCGAVFLM